MSDSTDTTPVDPVPDASAATDKDNDVTSTNDVDVSPPVVAPRGRGVPITLLLIGAVLAAIGAALYLRAAQKEQVIFTKTIQGIFKHKGLLDFI
jgi:hypothetical protein